MELIETRLLLGIAVLLLCYPGLAIMFILFAKIKKEKAVNALITSSLISYIIGLGILVFEMEVW
jgi:hypothetical protein